MKEEGGKSIDNYEIIETVHESAEGVIYRAVEKLSNTKVLIKKYYPSLGWSEDVLNEFFNLFSYLRFIEHEYLLPILDVGKDEGGPYVVFADNSLTFLCDRQAGQVSQKEIVNFLYNVAEALDFLHKQEILHGGLGPENIALDLDGYPLLFDFGLSGVFKKLLLENMDDGFDNLSIASLKCTSPEQILGRNPTRTSDIYTFGIIAYYYIFGEPPFDGRYVPEIAASHFNFGIIRSIKIPETIFNNTLQFIQKCIQLDPEARFANFAQILNILERMRSGRKARLRFDKRFTIKKTRIHIRLSPLFTSGAVLVISLFVFYYLFTRNVSTPPPIITATAPVVTKPATQTQKPVVETPTRSNLDTPPPTPVESVYKLAFEGEKPFVPNQPISITNLANMREISRLGYGKPEEADVAPDDDHTALATSAGVFIFEGNQLLKWIDPQGWATSVQFSPDGATLAIGLTTGEIQLWDWQSGTQSPPLTGTWHHTNKINRILFSQGGLLYSASADRHIIVWNLKSNQSIRDIAAHSQPVNDIAVTRDGRILVSCSDDQLIRVWDLNSGEKLYELGSASFEGSIKAVAVYTDELEDISYLAAGGASGRLYQWKLITTALSPGTLPLPRNDIVPVQERIWSVEYIRDGNELLVGADNGKSIIYDATRQKFEGVDRAFEIPKHDRDLLDAFGADFDFNSFSVFRGDNALSINWDGGVTYQQSQQVISPMFDNMDRLDFSTDGTILAAGGKRGSTHVWNLTTNQTTYQNFYFMPFGDPIAPNGSAIALIVPSSNNVGDIYQLKNLSGSQTTTDLTQTIRNANVGYTKDGNIFIAADLTTSKAWDYATGNEVHVKAQDYLGCRITVSENNIKDRLLVNSAAGSFLPGDDALIDNLCPKTYQFRGVASAFSHDLSLMAYINSNGALEGYDVLKKTSLWQPYQFNNPAAVTVIAVSPDGSIIAVGNNSGSILFINGKSGELISEIVGNFGKLQAIEFSEDGKKIATTGTDGIVRIFGIVEIK